MFMIVGDVLKKKKKLIPILLFILGILSVTAGVFLLRKDIRLYHSVKKEYLAMEKKDYGADELNALEKKVLKLNKVFQKEMLPKISEYRKYLGTKELIHIYHEEEEIPVDSIQLRLKEITDSYDSLIAKYRVRLKKDIESIESESDKINTFQAKIDNLFEDKEKTTIKSTVTYTLLDTYSTELSQFQQKDFVEKNKTNLYQARVLLDKRLKEIEEAWLILNVPYISQNENNILNGCEVATMLMALQYKGYLKEMTLGEFVTYMPMSPDSDAYKGFTHDVYTKEPETVPHWIAPPPLIEFSKQVSGNPNIVDSTGWSVDDLDKELDHNNPVIIYLIDRLHDPDEIVEGVPKNLHVMLLTGYNKITGEQYIVDPWKHYDGQIIWKVSKDVLVQQYSYVGMRSVVVR